MSAGATAAAQAEPYTLTDCAHLLVIQDAQIGRALTDLITTAERTIFIVQYQFRAPFNPKPAMKTILDELMAAADRGLDIRILLNHPNPPHRQQADHGRLLAALAHRNIEIRHYVTSRILHAKLAIFDERVTLLGSHNFSQPSFSTSKNLSVLIDAPTFALRTTRICDALWAEARNAAGPRPNTPA